MKKKIQILLIHGGTTFKKHKDYLKFLKTRPVSIEKRIRWSEEYLDIRLGRDFEIIRPVMPLKENARYDDWKIHFERYFPYLRNDLILIGTSLGGIFLAKYLSESRFPKRILSVYLICPPFDDTLPGEDLAGGFKLKSDLSLIEKNTRNLYLLFSRDDDVVPVSHAAKYAARLKKANIIIYASKNGHFKLSEFPEIIKTIRNDVNYMSH
ncbi:MAG: alpha/beta hydrolase [Candidatus Edwardsbacteria bacterium]|nr:alpha/beta hydrolase [Candidatus Edwardsbacteria bacterium]